MKKHKHPCFSCPYHKKSSESIGWLSRENKKTYYCKSCFNWQLRNCMNNWICGKLL